MEEQGPLVKQWADNIRKEIEPLLHDADVFFGGRKELTLAEVFAVPALLRHELAVREGLINPLFKEEYEKLPNFSKWTRAILANANVQASWDESYVTQHIKSAAEMLRDKQVRKHVLTLFEPTTSRIAG